MTLIQKLIMLDQRLSMRTHAPKPIAHVPTPAETNCKAVMRQDAKTHIAATTAAVGVYRA